MGYYRLIARLISYNKLLFFRIDLRLQFSPKKGGGQTHLFDSTNRITGTSSIHITEGLDYTTRERFAVTSRRTPTGEASYSVSTDCRVAALSVWTKHLRTFVYIHAFVSCISSKSLRTRALIAAQYVSTNRILSALTKRSENVGHIR